MLLRDQGYDGACEVRMEDGQERQTMRLVIDSMRCVKVSWRFSALLSSAIHSCSSASHERWG